MYMVYVECCRGVQDLPSGEEGHTVNVFKMPGNLPKNRFRNIAVCKN